MCVSYRLCRIENDASGNEIAYSCWQLSESFPLRNLTTTTALFLLHSKSKTCCCAKNSFVNRFFKYQKTIPVVGGYFSTMFFSPWNTSPPHRCVISKVNSSKGTLHLNRPVILDQGSQMLKFMASCRNWYVVEEQRKEKNT